MPDDGRIAVVGPNGAGKSTLLKIIAGVERVEGGEVTRARGITCAYLPQIIDGDEGTAVATVLAARPDIAEIGAELKACEEDLAKPEVSADLGRMGRVLRRQERASERWVEAGGAGVEGEARRYLLDLGLDDDDLNVPRAVLSGGQRKLVGLAACLIRQPDVLLLDEPETHLDADRRGRLEEMIGMLSGAVVIVSHDRYLLDETVEQIAELESGKIALWPGSYSAYAVAKELALLRQQQQFVTQRKEFARLENAVRRFRHWGAVGGNEKFFKKARQKQRQIDRMEKIERPVFERRKIALGLRSGQRGGQKVVQLRGVTAAFDDDPVLLDVDLTIMRGERVGIVGANGAGKTVLGKLIAGELEPTAGERWAGPSIRFGYLAQGHETEPPTMTPLEFVRGTQAMYEDEAVALLGQFLFRYDQMRQPVGTLSGGERTRLQFLLLMLSGANCLLLDEPTNHLDIESSEVLEGALERYDGTAIIISHDRYFLDRIPDRIVEVREGEVGSFEGGYTDWIKARASLLA